MSPNKIKALLVEHKVKQKEIARELGVTRGAVSAAISGNPKYRSRRVHEAVARCIGRSIEELWPALYHKSSPYSSSAVPRGIRRTDGSARLS